MDKIDQHLLALLRRDSRMPLSELAGNIGIARATARTRIEKMVATGIIRGFTVSLQTETEDVPVRALMMLGIEGRGTDRIIGRLLGLTDIRTVHKTNGKWDLIVEIGTQSLETLDQTLSAIRRLEGVQTSETSLLLSSRGAG